MILKVGKMKLVNFITCSLLAVFGSSVALANNFYGFNKTGPVIGCDIHDGDSFGNGTFHPDGGPPEAWPWGLEVKFPWNEVTGVWIAGADDSSQFYVFKPVGTSKSGHELEITLYDPSACQSVALGTGYENLDTHIVTALMETTDGTTYEMSVHAFNPATVGPRCENQSVQDGSVLMVLRIYPPSQQPPILNYQLRQIDNSTDPLCF